MPLSYVIIIVGPNQGTKLELGFSLFAFGKCDLMHSGTGIGHWDSENNLKTGNGKNVVGSGEGLYVSK